MTKELRQAVAKAAAITLTHTIFDEVTYQVDKLQLIDDDRIGVVVKGHEMFIYKDDVKTYIHNDKEFIISDGRLKISIKCQKI